MFRKSTCIAFVVLALMAGGAWSAKPGEIYRETLAPRDGLLRFFGELRPAELRLTDRPTKPVRGMPKVAGRVRFGAIKLGNAPDAAVALVFVGSGGGQPKLYVDSNRDGSLANEKPIECQGGRVYRADFTASAKYKGGKSIPTHVVILIPGDPRIGSAIYAVDTYRQGSIKLADGNAAFALVDLDENADFKNLDGDALLIDSTGKGDFADNSNPAEPYDSQRPFNINGVTYEVAYIDPAGTQLALRVSERTVAARTVLRTGSEAPDFAAVDANGNRASLADYRGKIVLLDFWAVWCGPCLREMPNVKKAYDRFHDQDFEILGVSLDQSKSKMMDYTKQNGMPWRQICDGKMWNSDIARMYRIRAIPASFLLDKEGKIIARDLRGEDLIKAVEKAVGTRGKEG